MIDHVYWNRHRKMWSLRCSGRVWDHRTHLAMAHCHFHVNVKGLERIRNSGRRTVVAWIVGETYDDLPAGVLKHIQVRFDPWAPVNHFFVPPAETKIEYARWLWLDPLGKVWT